jgi:hypothetical protein
MTARSDPSDSSASLLWVCAPWGWALGSGADPEPWVAQPWPEGGVPEALPELDWSLVLSRAQADHPWPDGAPVNVWLSHSPEYPAPHWWPLTRGSLRLWRTWLRSAGSSLGEVRQDRAAAWDEAIWPAACAGWLATPPASRPWLRRWRSPWVQMLISGLAASALHLGLQRIVQPALLQHRAQERAQLEAHWLAEQQKKTLQREALQQAEQDKQVRDWQAQQRISLKPLQQLDRLLTDVHALSQPQFWSELRHAEGSWTVVGVAAQEAAWHAAAQTLADWQPQTLESGVGMWAPPGSPAWPAWRFQARLHEVIRPGDGP